MLPGARVSRLLVGLVSVMLIVSMLLGALPGPGI